MILKSAARHKVRRLRAVNDACRRAENAAAAGRLVLEHARRAVIILRGGLEANDDDEVANDGKNEAGEEPLSAHQTEALRILADYVVVGRQLLADNRQPGSEAPN